MAVALTTLFAPPPQCTTDVWQIRYDSTQVYALLGGTGYSSCLPTSYIPTSTFYYSPGLQCPEGYSTAVSSVNSIGSETETILTCCPTGYSAQTAPVGTYPWEYTLGCVSECSSRYTTTKLAVSSVVTAVCDFGFGNNAYSVQLRFRASDLVTTTSSIPTSSSSLPSSIPTSAILTSTTASSSTPPSSGSGLSTSAKAGIGVGSVIGVALVAAILYLAWVIRNKSRTTSRTSQEPFANGSTSNIAEYQPVQLDSIPVAEMSEQYRHNPQHAYHQRHELG